MQKDTASVFLENLGKRSGKYQRNERLDSLLAELQDLLEPVDKIATRTYAGPTFPPLFVVGNPRSGTTLTMQILNDLGQFAIPTNLLSRFYYAPYIGGKIQQLLTDSRYDYHEELYDLASADAYRSSLGKTQGALSPSEFFHFWRRFLPNYDPEYLPPEQQRLVNGSGLSSGVAAIEAVFQKPFAAKAIILQYNLPILYEIFPNALFLYVKRNPLFVMQSILQAREAFYQDRHIWWSVKPKEYGELIKLDVYEQIAGQVYFTEEALNKAFDDLPDNHQLTVDYEELCDQPMAFYQTLREKYVSLGYPLDSHYSGPKRFSSGNSIRLSDDDITCFRNAYHRLSGKWPDGDKYRRLSAD